MNTDFHVSTSLSLLDRSIAGEQDAWNCLNEIYAPMIYRWVRSCGIQSEDARDITQQTFIKVFEGLRGFERGRGRFRGWLWTISRNYVRMWLRRHSANDTVDPSHLADLEEPPWDAMESPAPPKEIVRRALEHLHNDFDDRARTIVRETVMANRPAQDVADELGVSVNTVYIAKSRALKRLRTLLADFEYPTQ